MKHFYDSTDIKDLLALNSKRTAQHRIQMLNEELKGRGFWVERGKVPVQFFHEKYPYVEQTIEEVVNHNVHQS